MRRILMVLGILIVLVLAAAGGGAVWVLNSLDAAGPLEESKVVLVPRGAGIGTISQRLEKAGVVEDATLFSFAARYHARQESLKAGEYDFPAGVSMNQVIALIQSGRTVARRLTIAEGLTTREALDIVARADGLSGTITRTPAEGALLPETWHFTRGDSRDELISRMEKSMQDTVAALWPTRQKGLPIKTPQEAVILASIVEKETGVKSERPRVAAVFINRLNKGMMLQSDPTVIYALTKGKHDLGRSLTRRDLTSQDPYNSYVYTGLPPGPICNPGRASIAAVLNPDETQEYYFVADGTGGHAFARTLNEHNANVRQWRKIQRERGLR